MATIVNQYYDTERQKEVIEYDNGALKEAGTGYWIKPPPKAVITQDNAREMLKLKREKFQRAVLASMAEAARGSSITTQKGSVAAVAEVGGLLMRDIVLNDEAKHRDRRETYADLVRMAGLYAPNERPEPAQGGASATITIDADAIGAILAAIQSRKGDNG